MTNDESPDPKDEGKPRAKREVTLTIFVGVAAFLVTFFVSVYKNQFGQKQNDIFNSIYLMLAIGGIALVTQLVAYLLKNRESLLSILFRKISVLVALPLLVIGLTIAGASGHVDVMPFGIDVVLWGFGCVAAAVGGYAIAANEAIQKTWKKCAVVSLALLAGLASGLVLSEPLANIIQAQFGTKNENAFVYPIVRPI